MATNEENKNNEGNSSVIQEAFMDAEKLEEVLKENSKDMIRSTLNDEVSKLVKESLNEDDDEEEDYEEEEVGDEEDEASDEENAGGEETDSYEFGDEAGGEEDYSSDYSGEEESPEDYSSEYPEGGEEAGGASEEPLDLTNASDEQVIDIYKKLNGSDQVEVVDQNEIKFTDSAGEEYYIKTGDNESASESEYDMESAGYGESYNIGENDQVNENDEPMYRIELDEDDGNTGKPRKSGHDPRDQVKGASAPKDPDSANAPTDNENHGDNLEGGFEEDEATQDGVGHHAEHVMEDEDDIRLEDLNLEEDEDGTREMGEKTGYDINEEGGEESLDDMPDKLSAYRDDDEEEELPTDIDVDDFDDVDDAGGEDEEVEENSVRSFNNGRNQSLKPDQFPKNRMGGRGDHFEKTRGIGDSDQSKESKERVDEVKKNYNKLLDEAKKLKKENEEFKKSLKKFRNMLSETALFNTNLTHAMKLFLEHSTTPEEKEKILQRFDEEVETINESKKLYKTLDSEYRNKETVNESVEDKIEKPQSSGSQSQLNETNAYDDTARMKELMQFVDKK